MYLLRDVFEVPSGLIWRSLDFRGKVWKLLLTDMKSISECEQVIQVTHREKKQEVHG